MSSSNPKATFGLRLQQARKMAGLSLRELSDKIDRAVSHAALAKYEKGLMMPDSSLLTVLSRTLGQSPDFFLRPPTLKLTDVRFRKMARLARTAEDAIRDSALDYFERYAEIEELLGIAKPFTNPLGVRAIASPEDAEDQAKALRKEWHLGHDPIPNVIAMLEGKGIKIQEIQTEDRHFDGLCATTEAGPVIAIASWLNGNILRKRMTVVHELAHVVLTLPKRLAEKDEEKLIARFAGAFLLPADSFREQFGRHRSAITLDELIQLKIFYGASITAIMMRAWQLGLISAAIHNRFWSEWGIQWKRAQCEPGDDDCQLRETPQRFRLLVHRAAAEQVISLSKGASLLGVTLGEFREGLRKVMT